MGTASHSQTISADADRVWAYLGDFNGLSRWHPDVKTSALEDGGQVRRLALHNGAEIVERLIALDPAARICRYSIIGGPLPIKRHEAAIEIRSANGASVVDWRCDFESAGPPDSELIPVFRQIFQTGLTNLKSILET
jgi:hypothetical protein